jgi:hypothetical protein
MGVWQPAPKRITMTCGSHLSVPQVPFLFILSVSLSCKIEEPTGGWPAADGEGVVATKVPCVANDELVRDRGARSLCSGQQ